MGDLTRSKSVTKCQTPRHALRAPPDGNASGWPGCGCAISAQSRLHLKGISHLEIAPRSRTWTQATQRRCKLAEVAEHSTEISGTPGIAGRRRTEREREWVAHTVRGACVARLRERDFHDGSRVKGSKNASAHHKSHTNPSSGHIK